MKKLLASVFGRLLFVLLLSILAVLFWKMSASADEEEEVRVDNGIPVVYLNIDETRGTIQEMIESVDHSVYCYGKITITVPEGFHYSDFEDLACEGFEDMDMSIRGRGNSSWRKGKKPFKIKLDKKTDVFGLGKNKHWVLIANVSDESLLRDRITGWLGDEMGFVFTPRGVPVDVVMTGQEFGTQYLGSYYLSENVRVGENRLEIEELEKGDTDPKIITGGYLIQNAAQVRDGSPDRFYTSRGVDWATHTPSFDTEEENSLSEEADEEDREEAFFGAEFGDAYENPAQQEYIQKYIQDFEDVLFEGGTAYRELMDVESAAKYWLVQMITLNSDAYATGSTYLYKDRDPENGVAKLYWGPLWDFDYAYNFHVITTGLDYGHLWMKPLFRDKGEGGFVEELHKQWPVMREALLRLIEDGGLIDRYCEETKASAEFDALMLHNNPDFDYVEAVEELKTWIRDRIAWVDENFDLVDRMVLEVTFAAEGETLKSVLVGNGDYCRETLEHPEKEGYIFLGWFDEDGNIIDDTTHIERDMTLTAKYIAESEATHGEDIVFPRDDVVIAYSVHIHSYQIEYEVIPEDAIDKRVEWSSSDENFATIDEFGEIHFEGAGTATFTAKLKYGQTRSFTLTVSKDEAVPAAAIKAETEELTMTVGEQKGLRFVTDPSPAWIDDILYESEDPGIVTVSELGVLTAVSAGETHVRIQVSVYARDGSETIYEADTKVTVLEKEPDESSSEDETKPSRETTEISTAPVETTPADDKPDSPDEPGKNGGMHWGWFVLIGAGVLLLIAGAVLLLRKKQKRE